MRRAHHWRRRRGRGRADARARRRRGHCRSGENPGCRTRSAHRRRLDRAYSFRRTCFPRGIGRTRRRTCHRRRRAKGRLSRNLRRGACRHARCGRRRSSQYSRNEVRSARSSIPVYVRAALHRPLKQRGGHFLNLYTIPLSACWTREESETRRQHNHKPTDKAPLLVSHSVSWEESTSPPQLSDPTVAPSCSGPPRDRRSALPNNRRSPRREPSARHPPSLAPSAR